ncbi:MAG: alcohol dehydrogenase catalytic domain-containing protein [Firmicutes bacterium]|nr:alcohol dehydrogenase catalytic domain-containing protein [Bacillota bacterium]
MKQAVMTAPGKIEFQQVERPVPGPGQILVKIMRIGVCGSDIHVYHGLHPYTSYPVVQGHEVAGTIAELGSGVEGFEIGDKVTVQPQVSCGQCYSCRHGNYHICDDLKVMGFQTTGMAAEYFAVDAEKVLKLPDDMDYDEAAMVEPLAVAVHAIRKAGSVEGKKVVVLGAGPIGNLVAQAAKGMGAHLVLMTDISDYRLDIGRQCGIKHCIDTSKVDLNEQISEVFGPDRADIIFECVGVQATIEQAVENARKGSDIIVVGVFGDKPQVDMGLVQDRELSLIGTLMYKEEDYIKAIELIDAGKIALRPLITDSFAFEDYLAAYEHIEEVKGHSMKVMIRVQED